MEPGRSVELQEQTSGRGLGTHQGVTSWAGSVCPTWRLLQWARGTGRVELVGEGSWAWFLIPVRWGLRGGEGAWADAPGVKEACICLGGNTAPPKPWETGT